MQDALFSKVTTQAHALHDLRVSNLVVYAQSAITVISGCDLVCDTQFSKVVNWGLWWRNITTKSKRGKHGRCNDFRKKSDCGEVVAKENDVILLLFFFFS